MRNRLRSRYAVPAQAALVCVLLAAQAMAFAHGLDDDSHRPGEVCAICVTVGGLGGVSPAKSQPDVAALGLAHEPPPHRQQILPRAFPRRALPRGPPAAS